MCISFIIRCSYIRNIPLPIGTALFARMPSSQAQGTVLSRRPGLLCVLVYSSLNQPVQMFTSVAIYFNMVNAYHHRTAVFMVNCACDNDDIINGIHAHCHTSLCCLTCAVFPEGRSYLPWWTLWKFLAVKFMGDDCLQMVLGDLRYQEQYMFIRTNTCTT